MNLPPSENSPLILNLNESLSESDSVKVIKPKTSRKKIIENFNSPPRLSAKNKKMKFYTPKNRKSISGYFNYTDKVAKRMYLENIKSKTKRNTELLSKLSSTFRTCRFQSDIKDPKIESNLFSIGVKRSSLLTKRMNIVKNMIQNFDDRFLINLNDDKNTSNKNNPKKSEELQKIEEESSSFDIDINEFGYNESKIELNKTNSSNSNKGKNKPTLFLTSTLKKKEKKSSFIKEYLKSKKGKKFMKEQEKIENRIKNWPKLLELEDAFKYYELFYNYKYFYTKEDNEFLSFSRRRKMERAMSSYYLRPRLKLSKHEEICEKCKNNKKVDGQKYKSNQNIHINKNFINENENNEDNNINNNNFNSEREMSKNGALKLSLSEDIDNNKKIFIPPPQNFKSQKNIKSSLNFKNNSKFNEKTRPTSASISNSISQKGQSSLFTNNNNNRLKLKTKTKSELELFDSGISNSSSFYSNLIFNKKTTVAERNKTGIKLKKKIKKLSEGIIDSGDKLKTELKEKYKSILKQIEEEKKPISKIKKKRNIDINNIRKELKLNKNGKGIDENKLIMDNVDKLKKSLPKTHVDLMRSIAKIVINEDRMRHKPLVYDNSYDNKIFKAKLKKEMFEATCDMKKIRESLNKNKNKKEKPFKQAVKKLMENEMFLFFNLKSLNNMVNKIKVLKGECINNNNL